MFTILATLHMPCFLHPCMHRKSHICFILHFLATLYYTKTFSLYKKPPIICLTYHTHRQCSVRVYQSFCTKTSHQYYKNYDYTITCTPLRTKYGYYKIADVNR